MEDAAVVDLSEWIVRGGLDGASETDLLDGFCARCMGAGLALGSAIVIIDTLHPVWEGRVFAWRNDGRELEAVTEFGSTSHGEENRRWRRSAFYHLMTNGQDEVRRRLGRGEPADFYTLDELAALGHTDYLAFVHRFADGGIVGEMDCIYSHWSTRAAAGFREGDCAALRRLVPTLALALRAASLGRIARTVTEVYLGRDAARRVLQGGIRRGVTERINAVLWFSDLRRFTTIADASEPGEIIPLLNDYAEAVITSVHEQGGDVLKLIGDGVLAVFQTESIAAASDAALRAEAALRARLGALNVRRSAGSPRDGVRLGLHVGEVFYGNIGSDERLDFTVVGPAVNEVSRIVALCSSVDRDLLASTEFVDALPAAGKARFVSVGRFALRGVRRPQELFTLDPDAPVPPNPDEAVLPGNDPLTSRAGVGVKRLAGVLEGGG